MSSSRSRILMAAFVLLASCFVYCAPVDQSRSALSPRSSKLRFNKDGTFQIGIFNDLHFGEGEDVSWGPEQDVNTTRVMNAVLDHESPDLVVLNGDLITGENTFLPNSTDYVDVVVAPLVQRKLLWCSTYGNHDNDYNLSTRGILAREQRYPNSLTTSMFQSRDAGVSNYYLEIYDSSPNPLFDAFEVPKIILWFFDSRGGNYYQELSMSGAEVPQPNWVDSSVANWLKTTSSTLKAKYRKSIPSLAFYHIPVQAMLSFQQNSGVNPNEEPGINDDNPLAQQGSASGQGDVAGTTFTYSGQDVPFMEALLDLDGLIATFSGHDHGDDWCQKWDGILPETNGLRGNGIVLCFGRHTGYGGYGTWIRGGRQVLLNLKTLSSSVETWVRREDGSVSGKVSLNSTYGEDQYPAVADIFT